MNAEQHRRDPTPATLDSLAEIASAREELARVEADLAHAERELAAARTEAAVAARQTGIIPIMAESAIAEWDGEVRSLRWERDDLRERLLTCESAMRQRLVRLLQFDDLTQRVADLEAVVAKLLKGDLR